MRTCDTDNLRSKAIPEKLGYKLIATLPKNRPKPITGELTDTLVYVRTDLIGLPELMVLWGPNESYKNKTKKTFERLKLLKQKHPVGKSSEVIKWKDDKKK